MKAKTFYSEYAYTARNKPDRYMERVRMLSQMGYDAEHIEEALRYSDFNVEDAAHLLSDDTEKARAEQAFLAGRRHHRGLEFLRRDLIDDRIRRRMEERERERAR